MGQQSSVSLSAASAAATRRVVLVRKHGISTCAQERKQDFREGGGRLTKITSIVAAKIRTRADIAKKFFACRIRT